MNSNPKKNLTPKQKDLVRRLEEIRQKQNKKENQKRNLQEESRNQDQRPREKNSRRRNEDVQQKPKKENKKYEKRETYSQGPKARAAYKAPDRDRKRTPITKKNVQAKKVRKSSIAKQLSSGKSLSQALVLSEILDKPVSLRRK